MHSSIFNFTGATRSTRSARMAKKRDTAGPANNAKMIWESLIDSASMEKQRKDETKQKLLKDLIAMQAQDEEGLYEVLQGLMGKVTARMVPNILEIVRKTTPAAGPALSEEQLNTQRWQRLRKDLQTMKSSDKKGHAALVADQIEDHHIAEKILPKVLDRVRSTTSGKIKVAEAFVPGGGRLNLGGRGESRSAVDKKKAAIAKVRLGVKNNIGTPMFRAMLKANTPGKPSTRENAISAPNFDAAANTPRTIRTPLQTIANTPIPGTQHPNTPVPETPVAEQDFTQPNDASFEARLHSPTSSPEARTPLCAQFCCSPYDRSRNMRTKRRRVSFGLVPYCSPVPEEASSPTTARSPEPSESSESNSDPMTNGTSPASLSNDTDRIVVETVLEEEEDHEQEASSDPMVLDEMPPASPIPARSPEPSESSNGMSPASLSKDTDRIVVEPVLEEEDDHEEAPMMNGMSASSSNDTDPIEEDESAPIEMFPSNVSDSGAASDPTPVATSLPRSPPKDRRRPNPSSAHIPVVQCPSRRRNKKRRATLTFEQKQELCKNAMGEETINHLEKNKETYTATDRRPFLAAVAHHAKKVIEKVAGVKISAQEYKNIRIHAKYPGSYKNARKPRVFRNKIGKDLLLKLLHHLDDPGNLQRLAVGRQMVEIMKGQKCVELDNVTRNKTCATLAAEFIVKLGEQMEAVVMAEDGTTTPLPESSDRCQCLEKGTGRRCMKARGHDKRLDHGSGEEDEIDPKQYHHKYTPKGSISLTTAMELVGTLTGEDLKALCGLDDIKVAKGMENFERMREITDLYFSGAGKDQMKQRIDDHELFCQTNFVPHLQEVSQNNCNCLTCGFCNESK
jgi:hypothetical protein